MPLMKKHKPEIEIQKVPEGKEKIKFKITFEGEWDWNREFAFEENQFDGPSPLNTYSFVKDIDSFKKAFGEYVIEICFGRTNNMFESASINEVIISDEIQAAYAAFRNAKNQKKKVDAQKELAALEEKTAKLRKELKGK